jgi:malate synthase
MDEETMKLGLLMETAQTHQKLAEALIEKLQSHTQGLDAIVRDQIRRTLLEQLQGLHAESQRTAEALRSAQRQIQTRTLVRTVAMMGLSALVTLAIALGVAWYVLPSRTDIEALRAEREGLASNVAQLEQHGARADLRRCGGEHLCVRVDLSAPRFGQQRDYFVIRGY